MSEPDYIVVRGTDSFFDGRWYDCATLTAAPSTLVGATLTLVPSGRFEVRDSDGAVAEVWVPAASTDGEAERET